MKIEVVKNQGLSIRLASSGPMPLRNSKEGAGYYKIRSYQGGGEFFEHDTAQLILQNLGEFLPRATVRPTSDGGLELLYEHFVNGRDVCHLSSPLNSGTEIPAREIERLQAAIKVFKSKEADPATDATRRAIISAFRLPDPRKDPELYRLYGSGSNRRVLVLWGIEKEAGTSLTPQEAVSQVTATKTLGFGKFLPLGLAAAFLAAGGLYLLSKKDHTEGADVPPHTGTDAQPEVVSSPRPAGTSPANPAAEVSIPVGTGKHPSPEIVKPANGQNQTVQPVIVAAPSVSAGAPNKSFPSKSPDDGPTQSVPLGVPLPAPTAPAVGEKPRDPQASPVVAGESVFPQVEKVKTVQDLPQNPTANVPQSPNGPPPALGTQPESKMPSEPLTSSTAPSQPKAKAIDNNESSEPAEKVASGSLKAIKDSVVDAGSSSLAAIKDLASTLGPLAEPSTPPPSGQAYIEVRALRSNNPPSSGLVEVGLSAYLHREDGSIIPLDAVVQWTVDGELQKNTSGEAINKAPIMLKLNEGQHKIWVNALLSDGKLVEGGARVEAEIKRTETSTIKMTPESPKQSPK